MSEDLRSSLDEALRALEEARARLETSELRQREPIAILGMACHFPGEASTPEKYWSNLRDRVDAVTEIPRERFDIDRYYDPRPGQPGKTNTRYGAFLKGIQGFDTAFAGVAPRNAASVDPQQRVLGAVCWQALEDAGIAPYSLEGSLTGVFVGIWSVEYWQRLASRPATELDANVIGGNIHSMAAGGVSYLLGLRGPSLVVDTACSSSLVAVDLASQSLRAGACDLALAGGVNVVLGPENYICLSASEVLAADGRCKSFDAAADGFSRGEGAGAVVLKRLSDAVRDLDPILAVIHGSCVNQDGKTGGITVPNGEAQEQAVRRALLQARIAPADVQYVEAHGTGTPVGDPIEMVALGRAYGEGRSKDRPLLVGTVKTNIGHLESAAGIAGFIKVVLALQQEELPPNLHFKTPSPRIPWADLPVKVITETTPWRRGDRPRFAGVSAFGASGTNAHVVVGEAPRIEEPPPTHSERPRHLLTLSARTRDALRAAASRLAAHLVDHPELPVGDVCYTANVGRSPFKERLAFTTSSTGELRQKLERVGAGEWPAGVATGRVRRSARPALAFAFTGQGSVHPQMGRGLYETQPAFRPAIDRCDEILRPLMNGRLLDVLYPLPGLAIPLVNTPWTQPALFALEYALSEMWRSWGVEPAFVLGHSDGECVAACVAGVFSLEDGLALVAARARLIDTLPREGQMVAVFTSEARVAAAVAPFAQDVAIATVNGPENVVISGRSAAVEAIVRLCEAEGLSTRRLEVSHAFHSPLMDPMLADFERAAREVAYAAPRIPLVSNLTGALAGPEVAAAGYWVRHLRETVRFADGVRALHALGCGVFLELGPKAVLSRMGVACLPAGASTWLPSLRSGQDEWECALHALAELWVRGAGIDWKAFDAGYGRRRRSLPTYPFQAKKHWIEPSENGRSAVHRTWLQGLLDAHKEGRIESEVRSAGALSEEQAQLLGGQLEAFAAEYERQRSSPRSLVAEYYDAIPAAARQLETGSLEEEAERYLTFGPFHEIRPDFSWLATFADPLRYPDQTRQAFEAQKELREALFRKVDLTACRSALDIGCGYASDLVRLAQEHPQLELTGYTLASEQARIGLAKVQALGLEGRVQVLNRDSAKDDFPGRYDLVFGLEVAHHVADKPALFANIGRHLDEGGTLLLADFISRAGFALDHAQTSSFLVTLGEWNELLSRHHLQVVSCVDVSQEIANFLHDPQFDATLAKVDAFRVDANIRAGFKSYDQLGKLLRKKLADYVLITCRKRSGLAVSELQRRNEAALASPTPYSEVALAGACYEVEWRPEPKVPQPTNGRRGGWLLLADGGPVGQALARRLEAAGDHCRTATLGEAFARLGPDRFVVNPARGEDVRRLVDEMMAAGDPVRGVVHLWSLDAEPVERLTAEGLAAAQISGSESVLHLVQAMAALKSAEKPRLWLVTRRAQAIGREPVEIAQAPLLGLGKTVLLEHPELWGGMVDLDADGSDAAAQAIFAELAAAEAEYHVAYRGGARQVARLVRRRRPAPQGPPVKADASYLVAGGLGALGLRIATWLVDQGARHLLLVGRKAPGATALEVIDMLERRATVLVAQADVAQAAEVAGVLENAAALPPLRGVVNAAGVLDDGVLEQQTQERFRAVLAPKVHGSFNLHEATKGRPLDFFVCLSSAAALFGSAGQGNYAAANAFMDALAHHRRATALRGLSVNWGAWAGGGMTSQLPARQRRQLAEAGVGEIDPAEGLALLGNLIAEGAAQVGVSPMSWAKYFKGMAPDRALPYFERVVPVGEPALHPLAASQAVDRVASMRQASGEERRQLLGLYLQEDVAKVLGFEDPGQVERDVTLLELGLDSLTAVQLRNLLRANLGADVPTSDLLEETSLEGLTDLLQERLSRHLEVI